MHTVEWLRHNIQLDFLYWMETCFKESPEKRQNKILKFQIKITQGQFIECVTNLPHWNG